VRHPAANIAQRGRADAIAGERSSGRVNSVVPSQWQAPETKLRTAITLFVACVAIVPLPVLRKTDGVESEES